ncbi:RNA polymerase Rpc34 [Dendrothele bispora CBS 962.96]|uniref:DNA-directed RNA polymerase III subunit RPC6 n=1 Tax=Dendrothele bispora (strain CBS 962.96) TaxID=1314807 RepID=A0A4S8MKJ2_DENBC|nr:RNA polymerase Rpc34 [Dendrothele bispora CBS 962.96]
MSTTNKRPLNELESRLHQAALATANNELTAKQAEAIIPDNKARQKALNFLLSVGYFRPLSDKKGTVAFRAVSKSELESTKDLTEEEKLVLGHIKTSGNEGIWTKHLKTKTNLHQNVIDRCIKTLTQKKLIKRVPSVQHPTRKIYMLEGVEPSVSLTGGPWYQDNELDTEFIESLTKACFKIIRDASFPQHRRSHHAEGGAGGAGGPALYPISKSPQYPTSQQIRNALKQARLTDIELSIEHIEMLLNVLVLDGEIEKVRGNVMGFGKSFSLFLTGN